MKSDLWAGLSTAASPPLCRLKGSCWEKEILVNAITHIPASIRRSILWSKWSLGMLGSQTNVCASFCCHLVPVLSDFLPMNLKSTGGVYLDWLQYTKHLIGRAQNQPTANWKDIYWDRLGMPQRNFNNTLSRGSKIHFRWLSTSHPVHTANQMGPNRWRLVVSLVTPGNMRKGAGQQFHRHAFNAHCRAWLHAEEFQKFQEIFFD